jgi:hypothetical protein
MGADAPARAASGPLDRRQLALEDARRRLVALATDLEPQTADEATLRSTAAELDTVVHRIRWVADVTADDRPARA